MQCPSINGIQFSKSGVKSLEELKQMIKNSGYLAKAVGYGTLVNIFLGNGVLKSSYNIANTDLSLMADGLKSIPDITRNRVKLISYMAWSNSVSYKEKQFWKAIHKGCTR